MTGLNSRLPIMAITRLRRDTSGRVYYQRKRAAGKSHREALRCLNGACPTGSTANSSPTPAATDPKGHTEATTSSSPHGAHPKGRISGQVTPGPVSPDPTMPEPRST